MDSAIPAGPGTARGMAAVSAMAEALVVGVVSEGLSVVEWAGDGVSDGADLTPAGADGMDLPMAPCMAI